MHSPSRLLNETLAGLSDIARRVRSRRRPGSLSTQAVWRWAVKGIKLPDGRVVKLETLKLAGRYMTSIEALERFIAAQNEPVTNPPVFDDIRSRSARERQSDRAAEFLTEKGI